jgi:hypothetical protein
MPIISDDLTFSPFRTLPSLFYASLSTPPRVQFCFIMSSIVYLASGPWMARLIGTAWTSTSTSGIAGIAEYPRTFVHPVSCSNLSLVSLSVIYALMSPLCSFLTAYILWVSGGPAAWSLCTIAWLFCFKASLWSAASPMRIIISCTSVGL